MKKILLSLAAVFTLSTSYVPSDPSLIQNSQQVAVNDTAASPITLTNANSLSTELSSATLKYQNINFADSKKLRFEVFNLALKGFEKLKKEGEISPSTTTLSIVDFSLSSNEPRFWVINLESGEVLFNSLVAHGKNTGEEFATDFSNTESSYQSSIGFYRTDQTYQGSNGYSLRLHGLDSGYNDRALERAIVMHGANYVSEEFGKRHKRIGRSWGCPAVPSILAHSIIDTIKEGSVLFHYYPDENYMASSKWLN